MAEPAACAAVAFRRRRSWVAVALAALVLGGCGQYQPKGVCVAPLPLTEWAHPLAGMARVPAGTYLMGAAPDRAEEGPPQRVRIDDFWIDRTEVTNAAFARFVAATGYVTLAEQPLDPRRYPGVAAPDLRPASLVFAGALADVSREDPGQWWRIIDGADWRHPLGPASSIAGKDQWPVVHVAYADALAYATWIGHGLPTEAQWEYAARGGLDGQRFVWGDAPQTRAAPRANTWQGIFPVGDTGDDGYPAQAAPVGCFPANGYGLYDMAGNVWEWTRDWYRPGLAAPDIVQRGALPPAAAFDPDEPGVAKHVLKGGSFLCSDDYCFRYRPAARAPGPPDSGASHIGFRTVLRNVAGPLPH